MLPHSNRLRAAAGDWRGGAALFVLCALLYVPGLWSIPPVDRDEARFAQASRQMLHSGTLEGWVVPRVQDEPRLKKPPLIYWLQAGSGAALGDELGATLSWTGEIWKFRVPSLLSAAAAVLITWRIGISMFHPVAAWLGGAILAGAWLVIADARLARADQLLLACTCAVQYALWRIWRESTARGTPTAPFKVGTPAATFARIALPVVFWIAIGLGILAKGPIAPAIAGFTALTLCLATRQWRWLWMLRPGVGVLVCAAMVVPWCVLVAQAVGWQTLLDTIYDEVVNRSSSAQEGHFGPPGYHAVLLPILLWPGSLLAVAGLQRGWRAARGGRKAELFLLAWVGPAWIVFEMIMTKLPHYPLPLYPALALLCGRAVCAAAAGGLRVPANFGVRLGIALWLMIGVAISIGVPLSLLWVGRGSMSMVALVLPAVIALGLAAAALRRGRWLRAQLWGGASGIAAAVSTFGVILPACEPLWLPSRLIAEVRRLDPANARPLASCGYFEDSLVFLTRGRIERLKPDGLAAWQRENPAGVVILEAGLAGEEFSGGVLGGFNYSAGRWERVVVICGDSD